MNLLKEIYDLLISLPSVPPESGGLLGGHNGTITMFVSDEGKAPDSDYKYEPDTEFLNAVIDKWINNGIDFMGICHTHPANCEKLSDVDIDYINKIMRSVSGYTDKLYFPLIIPNEKIVCFYALIVADEIRIFQDAIQLK